MYKRLVMICLVIWISCLSTAIAAHKESPDINVTQKKKEHEMTTQIGEVKAKVLAIIPIKDFDGEAILASADPHYVIVFMIDNTKHQYLSSDGKVSFTTYNVAFFAIHSVAKLFIESDIVGKSYNINIQSYIEGGVKRYSINIK